MRARAASTIVVIATALAPLVARADDAACFSAAVEGQKLQRAGKLLDARAKFVACGQRACPSAVVDKCEGWLRDVEASTPSLTIAVRDERGADVAATRATIDDRDATLATGGRALEVDPGSHVVAVEARGASLSQTIIMHEGEKVRAVVFDLPRSPPLAPLPGAVDQPPSRAALYGSIVAGGVAVASGAVFAVFAIQGISDRSRFGCASGCPDAEYDRVHRDFLVADVTLGVAIAALTAATVLFVTRPTKPAAPLNALASPRPALGFAF